MPKTITVKEIEAQADALEASGFYWEAVRLRNQWLTKDKLGRTKLARKPRTYQTEADVAAMTAANALREREAYENECRRLEEARESGKKAAREALQAIAEGRVEATKDEVYDLVDRLDDAYYETLVARFSVKRPSLM